MDAGSLEDERRVDRAAIRERLNLTPAARVDRLVEEIRVWTEILDSVIDSKRAAGRAEDIAALPYLESLRDELKER